MTIQLDEGDVRLNWQNGMALNLFWVRGYNFHLADQVNSGKVVSRKQKVESRKLKVDLIQFYFQNSCFPNKVASLLLIFQLFSMVKFPTHKAQPL